MQWDNSLNSGFTTGTPWLPLPEVSGRCNVESLSQNPGSILSLYRRIIEFRQREPALTHGRYSQIEISGADDLLCYERGRGSGRVVIVLNFGAHHQTAESPQLHDLRIAISAHGDRDGEPVASPLRVRGNEGLILTPESG
jgi:alpha-glucosidase